MFPENLSLRLTDLGRQEDGLQAIEIRRLTADVVPSHLIHLPLPR